MSKKENITPESYIKLSSVFIDKYMPSADGTFVKVYLAGLRSSCGGVNLTPKGIAAILGILESDVIRAWKYWSDMGVVSINYDDKNTPLISFLELSETGTVNPKILPAKPSYSASEITEFVSDHSEMRELLKFAEKALGKTLSSNDQSTIFSLHDWLGLPVDVIALLLSYCMTANKKSMRFIELTAINWNENEINTVKKAEKYLHDLKESNSKINSYKRAMGIFDRVLTKAESDFMLEWSGKLSSPTELVKLAAEITAINTGKISLPYMNTILQDWYSKGIKTAADARAMRSEFKKQSEKINTSNKFGDYSYKSTYDFNAIEQAAINIKPIKKQGE